MTEYDKHLNVPVETVQGNDWEVEYQILAVNDDIETPIDISGYTVNGVVKNTRTAPVNQTMTYVISDGPNGKFRVHLEDAQTNMLQLGSLYYQIDLNNNGFITTYVAGNFYVR